MLSKEDREAVERLLRGEREEALAALREFDQERSQTLQEEAGELSVYRFHMADIGTEAMEREKQFLLASKEGERLYRIDEALRRLYADPEAFGQCARCGSPIGLERLRLVPEVELCAACQDSLETGSAT
ncbi:MAG TPA: TraR/DksA C4-type zinc finger protein [Longimicrobiaceae bacterium]|nr:TraR/DksA C4-type zinc finger protein [Longimicrobiaceae bacterium]